jgi:hypothetical protein
MPATAERWETRSANGLAISNSLVEIRPSRTKSAPDPVKEWEQVKAAWKGDVAAWERYSGLKLPDVEIVPESAAPLTATQIKHTRNKNIFSAFRDGKTRQQIAEEFDMDYHNVCLIIRKFLKQTN